MWGGIFPQSSVIKFYTVQWTSSVINNLEWGSLYTMHQTVCLVEQNLQPPTFDAQSSKSQIQESSFPYKKELLQMSVVKMNSIIVRSVRKCFTYEARSFSWRWKPLSTWLKGFELKNVCAGHGHGAMYVNKVWTKTFKICHANLFNLWIRLLSSHIFCAMISGYFLPISEFHTNAIQKNDNTHGFLIANDLALFHFRFEVGTTRCVLFHRT